MRKYFVAIIIFSGLIIGNPSVAGVVPSTAKYYFTTSSINTGNLNDCATVMFSDWDGRFSRSGTGAQLLLGLVTYQNRVCSGTPSTLNGSLSINLYFEEPTFEVVNDPIQCAPFLSCSVEVGRRLVGSVIKDEVPFSVQLTTNTGNPNSDRDGAFFPAVNKTLWVKEGEMQSFFITASYASPITILNIIPVTSDGWVTTGTDPLGERVFASQLDLDLLALAGVEVEVPEPTSFALFGIGFLFCLRRYKKLGRVS